MVLHEFFERAVRLGINADVREPDGIAERLGIVRAEYDELNERDRAHFDLARLDNPIGDTRLLYGDPETEISGFLTGIDIGGEEVLLADALRRRGEPVDAVVAHHAAGLGPGLGSVEDVLSTQVHRMIASGVPAEKAKKLITDLCKRYESPVQQANDRVIAVAGLLDMPLMCIHMPADNYGLQYIRRVVEAPGIATVGDAVEALNEVPEFQRADRIGVPIRVPVGSQEAPVGRTHYCLAGGWNPSAESFQAILEAGVDTIVIHSLSSALLEVAKSFSVNVIDLPHYPTDTLGMNLLYDDIASGVDLAVFPCSNFFRVQPNSRK